ncbi:hypothetical protein EYF80_049811 [Liparis tanakae]|uniref:Uncharacterized protein n=1 Tax=Liparis tanakae TaxID=230148 RepID=A0A4Z2FGX0_9TELE|nr:hypothetical protein EYF80_049811 [Liparis tanakae]
MRREDQTSCAPQSGVRGGQLMTGYAVFPDITGPRPLLLPATATNTVGTPSPEGGGKHADVLRRDATVTFFSLFKEPPLTFVFGFDAERLVRALVSRGDPQDAGDPVGGAGLADLLTVRQVRASGSSYLDPLRDPLEVPLDRLHGLGGHFLEVAVHLGDEERSLELLGSLKEGRSPGDESPPACPSAGCGPRPATGATSRCRSRRRGRSLESSRSPRTRSTGEGEDPQGLDAFTSGGWGEGGGAGRTFMSTRVQFWVAQDFSRISKMATVLRFMTSTSHWPMARPAGENLAASSCSSDHWGSLLASSCREGTFY